MKRTGISETEFVESRRLSNTVTANTYEVQPRNT